MNLVGTILVFSSISGGFAANITFPIVARSPTNASQILDRRHASFSFEFAYLPNFGGNLSSPNVLTKELMQRLEERTGVGPDIRPGGITMYRAAICWHWPHRLTFSARSDSSEFDVSAPALDLDESSVGRIIIKKGK